MLALLAALSVVSVAPQMVNALNECPAGWTEHQPDGKRICYKLATYSDPIDHVAARALCAALHAESTLPMPKTAAQRDVLANYTNANNDHDSEWNDEHVGIDVDHTSGHKWLDGEKVDLDHLGYVGYCFSHPCLIQFSDEYQDFYLYGHDDRHRDGMQLCQIIIKEWSCLADRVKTANSPFNHYAHQALGCRQVLTCSARVMEDGALVNGLTVNLKQSPYGGGVSADIDLVLQEDLLVSIAFTEDTSPRSEDDAATCDAERLGLFLAPHNLPAGHHGLGLLSAVLSGHSQAGQPYPAGLHAFGHGYSHGRIYQTPRTLVTEVAVSGGVKATFNVQRVGGFTSLAELAGHGVVVCPSENVEEKDGVMRCLSDAIPACCSLAWALEADEQYLE